VKAATKKNELLKDKPWTKVDVDDKLPFFGQIPYKQRNHILEEMHPK